jgi:hypothetical protein
MRKAYLAVAAVALALVTAGCSDTTNLTGPAGPNRPAFGTTGTAGAGFTTFDATQGGCLDSPNGIDCNNYTDKGDVYMNGGPTGGGALTDGTYFFAVIAPGAQATFFSGTGLLSTDLESDRTFSIAGGVISYSGPHGTGTSTNGKFIVQLIPYDDTPNEGGVYILAICPVRTPPVNNPGPCKFDAFRIAGGGGGVREFPIVTGKKYYDVSPFGRYDGEVGIAGWQITYTDINTSISTTFTTDANGEFAFSLAPGTYDFQEVQANPPWLQTGNTVNQTTSSGGNSATLSNFVYRVTAVLGAEGAAAPRTDGLYFGNVCLAGGGGLTIGFWSNPNGQRLITSGDLYLLRSLNLRNADGSNFDPTTAPQVKTWLLNATAVNMAYMLSAQLAGMELNVAHGFVSGTALIYAPGTTSADAFGFATVNAVMAEANTELGAHSSTPAGSPDRAYQEALKNALDNANNNLNFVQPGPTTCPTPVFP